MLPGARFFGAHCVTARIIEELGYEAVYITGAGVSNTWLGMPDLSFIGLNEIAAHTSVIRDAVSLSIVVDANTGFGNAVNIYHAVRTLEREQTSSFLKHQKTMEELKAVPSTVDAPHLVNIVVGGKTPMVPTKELGDMGF